MNRPFTSATIYGSAKTKYMKKIFLPFGWRIHIIYRGDEDPDPHDHPADFYTIPLKNYAEQVWGTNQGPSNINVRQRFKKYFVPATYRHRILGREYGNDFPLVTLVKWLPKRRDWGFWPYDPVKGYRTFVYWKTYLREKGVTNFV